MWNANGAWKGKRREHKTLCGRIVEAIDVQFKSWQRARQVWPVRGFSGAMAFNQADL